MATPAACVLAGHGNDDAVSAGFIGCESRATLIRMGVRTVVGSAYCVCFTHLDDPDDTEHRAEHLPHTDKSECID
jgi:hypothetical protein